MTNAKKPVKKTFAVLTSGGDSPGMNAAVRAVVRSCTAKGIKILGIRHGFQGLMDEDIFEMHGEDVCGCMMQGGTILFTSRCEAMKTQEGVENAKLVCEKYEIDGVIVIGGDGSLRGASMLSLAGVPCIGIPATIDNDVAGTDYTIGFDTATNTVAEMVKRIKDTAASHDCCTVVEVMGRNCGDIALYAGLACGAIAILVPEMPFDIEKIVKKIKETIAFGKHHFIIMVAEGVIKEGRLESAQTLADIISQSAQIKTRTTDLGFVQRGGEPTVRERIIASEMGSCAVELLQAGKCNRTVVYHKERVIDMDISEALGQTRNFNEHLYSLAQMISM